MAHASLASAVDPNDDVGRERLAHGFSRASTNRLTTRDVERFQTDSLFDRLGRAVCAAGCLPRKELYEAWEMARRVRRRLRGGRVMDIAGGHGLLAHAMLLLDDSSPSAVVVDVSRPPSADRVMAALVRAWPRLDGRVGGVAASVDDVVIHAGDLVVSCHACGGLTDRVLARAVAHGAAVAVLPCCHEGGDASTDAIAGWMDAALALDTTRALRLQAAGYDVWTQHIPSDITPKNRLLIGRPRS